MAQEKFRESSSRPVWRIERNPRYRFFDIAPPSRIRSKSKTPNRTDSRGQDQERSHTTIRVDESGGAGLWGEKTFRVEESFPLIAKSY